MRWQTEQYGGTLRVAESRFDALQLSFGALLREAGPLAGVLPYFGTILCVLGLTAVGLGMRRSRADHGLYWYAVLLLLGSALIVPMERMRYFLPMVGPLAICGGVLIARLAVGRRRPVPPDPASSDSAQLDQGSLGDGSEGKSGPPT